MKNPINYHGTDWVSVRARLFDKLDNLYQSLADRSKDHSATQVIRGQIAQIKDILGWEKEDEQKINQE